MRRSTFLVAALAFAIGCSGCVATLQRPATGTKVILTPSFQLSIFSMYEATTGSFLGNEIGFCLVGSRVGSTIYILAAQAPTYMTGNTRVSIRDMQCSSVERLVGRVHFHPWPSTGDGTCARSERDAISHAIFGQPVDMVVCPNQRFRWYTADGSSGGN